MDFSKLDALVANLDIFGVPCWDCAVTYRHETVYRRRGGFADLEKTRLPSEDDVYFVYSCTKLVTAVAAMQLVEQGKLSLKDPVRKFFPEYGRFVQKGGTVVPAEREATVEDLLSMQGGVDYDLNKPHLTAFMREHPLASTQEYIHEFLKDPLLFEPGTDYFYSMCLDIVGAIIEQVSGERYSDYIRRHIADPLGWQVCSLQPTPELLARMPQFYQCDSEGYRYHRVPSFLTPVPRGANPYIIGENYDSAGAGLITRASDLMLLVDALANDGVGKNGFRVLTRASIDEMRTNRLDTPEKYFHHAFGLSDYGYGYGLAVRVLTDDRVSLSPKGEFGWDGAAGAFLLSDPENRISLTYFMSVRGLKDLKPAFHHRMRDLVYEALAAEIGR